jgi:thioredoxin reductase (NADPH)
MNRIHDVLVVGAGPSGLATAIAATEAGLSCAVLEKGSLVDYIRRFPANLVWFSTPELLELGSIPFVVPTTRPTRVDTLNYYRKVTEHFQLDVHQHDAVTEVARAGDLFEVRTRKGVVYQAKYVVIATGYFDTPNRLEVAGEELPQVSHYYQEPFDFPACDVVVVGGRNSAVEAALDLYRHGARVTLVHRGEKLSEGVKYWIQPDFENRVKAGQIAVRFGSRVTSIEENGVTLATPAGVEWLPADHTFVLIGYHPDTELLKRFGINIHPETLAPVCANGGLETSLPGLFVAGSAVAGKFNNKIFVENGRMHGEQIVKAIQAKELKP